MLTFSKLHGLGNDFVLLDAADLATPIGRDAAITLCDRHTGIGADGVLIRQTSTIAEHRMILWNADGSPAEISGNGLRCFALFLRLRGYATDNLFTIETGGGVMSARIIAANDVETTMPSPQKLQLDWAQGRTPQVQKLQSADQWFDVLPVNVGNPHGVIFGPKRDIPFAEKYGPPLERNPFFAEGANIQFAHVVSEQQVQLVVWERGAGITLACGSGSVATVCAGCAAGHFRFDHPVAVTMPGGTLSITVSDHFRQIRQRGPAVHIFTGSTSLI